jgi:DSF synthase
MAISGKFAIRRTAVSYLRLNPDYRRDVRARFVSSATDSKSASRRASVDAHHFAGHAPQIATGLKSLLEVEQLFELDLSYDQQRRILWQFMAPKGRPSFTPGLLRDMTAALDTVEKAFALPAPTGEHPIDFLVLASRMPGIFNLGGDLPHFMALIEHKSEKQLRWYARVCARGQYRRAINLELPICTIALIQGDALGGGFEAALAHDVIIAERGASFGLPEVLFNMFPGMGAFSFLARRLHPIHAERIILSGKVYSAEELHEIGVVDRLAEDGAGTDAVQEFVSEYQRARHTRQAVLKARKIITPVSLRELIDIADLWVETAMKLGPADLRKMNHLAKAQDRRWAKLQGDGGYSPRMPHIGGE